MWDESKTDTSLENNHGLFKEFVKVIQLSEESICVLQTSNNYLCLAGDDGAIPFYDFSIRLVAWFEDLNAGPIRSVNFIVRVISATYVHWNVTFTFQTLLCLWVMTLQSVLKLNNLMRVILWTIVV